MFRLENPEARLAADSSTDGSDCPKMVAQQQRRFVSAWGVGMIGFVSACLGLVIVVVSLAAWLRAPSPYAMLFSAGFAGLGLAISAYGCKWMHESTR